MNPNHTTTEPHPAKATRVNEALRLIGAGLNYWPATHRLNATQLY